MSARKRTTEAVTLAEPTITETLSKITKSKANWVNKDEFLDVLYWLRQVAGLIIGITWGLIPIKGIIGILLFFAVTTLFIYFYANNYQEVDEEEYGGVTEILKEGLMTSFATFIVSWIIIYSAIHYN